MVGISEHGKPGSIQMLATCYLLLDKSRSYTLNTGQILDLEILV